MKALKLVFPSVAFVIAMAAALASTQAKSNVLTVEGFTGPTTNCQSAGQVDCAISGNNDCVILGTSYYQSGCSTILRRP